jgi:hypothetical protein
MMYRIGNEQFEISEAGIVGRLLPDEGLVWALDVYAQGRDTDEFTYVEPKLSFTALPHPDSADRELQHLHFPHAVAYDDKTDEWIGDFYIYDGHFFRSELDLRRVSPTRFKIHWKGEVDTSPEQIPAEHFVPFEIEQEIVFPGILCEWTDEKTSRRILEPICETADLFWCGEDNGFFDSPFLSTKKLEIN